MNAHLVLIHGFWSGPETWERLTRRIDADGELRGLGVYPFPYESPKLSLPFSWTRIPDYDDIAQSLPSYLAAHAPDGAIAIVTHSQGGLILQRFLAWMLNRSRGRELARIKLIVMLSCPNEGSEYLRSIRAMARFGRHPQARDLRALRADVTDARRTVLRQIVQASHVNERECPIPVYVYAGRSDRVVRRTSAQGGFPHAATLPGNHFSILNPAAPNNLTFPTLRRHLLEHLDVAVEGSATSSGSAAPRAGNADGEPAAARPAPRLVDTGTLKRATGFFTGRAAQVRAIEAAVDAAGDARDVRAMFVIHGMPGVGKTTLATHVATRLAARLIDTARQVGFAGLARQVDLHGLEGLGRTDPGDALRDLLISDGFDRRKLSPTLDGLSAQWRSHVAGKLLVLLLDNAEHEEQVLPFLPGGSGHVVLVTSRRPLQGLALTQGATTIDLPVLPPTDASRLIRTVAGRTIGAADQQAIDGLADLCGYHPLAMTIAVAGLAGKPHITFAGRLTELRARPHRLLALDEYVNGESGGVARSFELSYRQLPDECRLVLRRMSLAPVPTMSVDAVAVLSGLAGPTVGRHLRRLEEEALTAAGPAGYHLHELIRHYARGLAGDDDAAENTVAVNRVLAYYHDAAAQVDAMLTRQPPPVAIEPPEAGVARRHFADRGSAIAWARTELPNLLACADHVQREAEGVDRDGAKAWVIRFALALAGLLRNDGLWPRSIELQTRAVTAAAQLRAPLAEANVHHERGQLRRLSGDLTGAAADLEEALALYRRVGGNAGGTGEAHVLNTYAVVLDQLKQPIEAQRRFAASLEGYRGLGNRLGEANVLHDQGMAEYFARRYDAAVHLLGAALSLYRAVDQPLGLAHAHSNLARAQRLAGQERDAADNLESAQALYRQLGNQLGEATTLVELGAALSRRSDYRAAAVALTRAEQLNREIGNQVGLGRTLKELGALRGATGDLAGAKELLMRSRELFRQHGLRRDEAAAWDQLTSLGLVDEASSGDP